MPLLVLQAALPLPPGKGFHFDGVDDQNPIGVQANLFEAIPAFPFGTLGQGEQTQEEDTGQQCSEIIQVNVLECALRQVKAAVFEL